MGPREASTAVDGRGYEPGFEMLVVLEFPCRAHEADEYILHDVLRVARRPHARQRDAIDGVRPCVDGVRHERFVLEGDGHRHSFREGSA